MFVHRYFMQAYFISFMLTGWLWCFCVIPPHAQGTGTAGRDRPFVRVQEGLVHVSIQAAPLAEVLQEISLQSGIKVVLHSARQAMVSAEFHAVPLEQALRQLIRENFLLLYAPDHHLLEAWVVNYDRPSSIHTMATQAPESPLPAGGRASFDGLISRVQEGDGEERGRAVLKLGESKDKRALESVIGTLQGDDDAGVRERAVWALEDLGGQRATAALVEALSGDDHDSVRRRAVEALAKIGGPDTLEPITRALREDPDRFVRYEALLHLAEIGGDQGLGPLREALNDPDELIWAKAEELLSVQANRGREP